MSAEASLLKTESGETAHNITLKESATNVFRNFKRLPESLRYAHDASSSSGGAVINGLGGNNTNAVTSHQCRPSNRLFNLTEYPGMSQANVDAIQEISYQTSNYAALSSGRDKVISST